MRFPTGAFEEVRIFGHPRVSQLTFEMLIVLKVLIFLSDAGPGSEDFSSPTVGPK